MNHVEMVIRRRGTRTGNEKRMRDHSDRGRGNAYATINGLIITITIFSNLIGALTALFFTNYCAVLKSDSEIRQLERKGKGLY